MGMGFLSSVQAVAGGGEQRLAIVSDRVG